MIIGKEALANIESLALAQYQVYPDSADIGIEVRPNQLNALRADVKTLKGIYRGTNYSPAPDYQGVKDIIIPIEWYGDTTTRCTVISVLVSQQFKTIAYIKITSAVIEDNKIPFMNKAVA